MYTHDQNYSPIDGRAKRKVRSKVKVLNLRATRVDWDEKKTSMNVAARRVLGTSYTVKPAGTHHKQYNESMISMRPRRGM